MNYVTDSLLVFSGFAVIFAMVVAARAALENRRERKAPFRNYFGSSHERGALLHGSFYETEDGRTERHSRSSLTLVRDPGASTSGTRSSEALGRNRRLS
jgi:hypothetical protein